MALLRSKPRYLLDTEAYLFDETFNDPTGLLSDTPTAAAAPVAAAPASDPVAIAPAPAPDPVAVATAPAFNWQPGQAWDPARTEGFTYGGDLYMPGFEDSPWGPQLTGLTRFIGGKQPEPGQTVYTESFDPMTGKPIPGLQVTPLTAYKVDPRGGTFWEAFTGALPMLAPIGAYAMGLGAAGAASAAGDAAGFIGEGVASGIPAWDAAAINAGVPLAGAPATLADLYEPAPPTGLGATGAASMATDVAGAASSALDAGMGVYPSTGLVVPSALDAGLGVYSLPTQDLSAAVAASASDTLPGLLADNVLPGIAEGMVPGVTAPATEKELAAVNDILNGTNLPSADYSNEGRNPTDRANMGGAETSQVATVNVDDTPWDKFKAWAMANPEIAKALFTGAGALLSTAGGSGGSGSGGYVDSGYRPTLTDRQPVSKQQSMPITPVSLILPTTGQANSGLWRYGLLGG